MFRLTKSVGSVSLLTALLASALLMGGCPEKYKPAVDAGPDASGPENTPAACSDGVDNDGDGDTDCADSECQGLDVCIETDCSDGIDNDGDGNADCLDTDCHTSIDCRENTAAACQDGIDNDGDGDTDCDDSECSTMLLCTVESNCDDGVDNDNDGDTDCDDHPDCDTAVNCGGFCYNLAFQAPGVWGMAITEANDDLDVNTACVQYDVVVQGTSPEANTQVCLYLDDLNSAAAGCADPNTQNPMTFRVDLCAGTHTLYARVEQGANVCTQTNLGLKQIQVEVYENPSCTITGPAGLSTDSGNPTCVNQADMDVLITTSGADAQLWIAGALTGTEDAVSGIVDFSGTALGSDADKTINALCDNPGDGNGDTWSPDYYITLDTTPPAIQIVSPSTGATYGASDCPFEVVVTGVEAGQEVCAHYTGQTPPAAACATSTAASDQHTLTVQCVDGVDLTLEANTQDTCANTAQATIQVTADTGLPAVFIESPVHGQVYNKADDTLDPATDAFELEITACTDQAYNPGNVTLVVDGLTVTSVTPTIQAASCGVLSHRITWSPVFAFAQSSSGLQTEHTVTVEVSDGFNTVQAAATFNNDTIAPVLDLNCGSCQPSKSFYTTAEDTCAGVPMEVQARLNVTGLETGEPVNLSVTGGGGPVGNSPYSSPSATTGPHWLAFETPCGVELQTGQNEFAFSATDQAGNAAIPATKTVAYGSGSITSPSSGAILSLGDDCDAGGAYGIEVIVQVEHATVTNGTPIEVFASSSAGFWSYPMAGSDVWSKNCTGDPCTHTFCIPVPAGEFEQTDIALSMTISGSTVPGGPENITIDVTDPPPATNPGMTVMIRRAAQIQLSWDSVEDAMTGVLAEWDVRCAEDASLTIGNWATAMQFAGEPAPAATGVAQTMLIAEDLNGNKIRAGHDYECGMRGRDNTGLWSSISLFPAVTQNDIGFVQYPSIIEGYTRTDYYFGYYASVEAAGDINGDSYDDLLVGFGVGSSSSTPGHAAAIYFGSSNGTSETSKLDISCSDDTFGGAMVGLGDFDVDPYSTGDPVAYPDIAIGAGGSDKVYIFRGHDGFGSSALDCSAADITIVGPAGSHFGSTIASAGDFDGDGYKDIAIGAFTYNSYAGAVWIVFGRSEASYPITINLNSGGNADGALFISGLEGATGQGFASGDLNKDGYWDLIATNPSGGVSGKGQLVILHGYAATKALDTVTTLTSADLSQIVEFTGPSAVWSSFGIRGVSSMDFDADGCTDVVVGAYGGTVGSGDANAGNVLVYRGQTSGATCTGLLETTYHAVTYGAIAGDKLGYITASGFSMSMASPEPWRINGLPTSASDVTLLTGAQQGVGSPGYVALWYGGFIGNKSSTQADVVISALASSVDFHWVSYVGDLDGDGYVDIAVGDPGYGSDGRIVLYH